MELHGRALLELVRAEVVRGGVVHNVHLSAGGGAQREEVGAAVDCELGVPSVGRVGRGL